MLVTELKIRVPLELKERLADRASNNDRSMAAEVVNILKTALKTDGNQPQAA